MGDSETENMVWGTDNFYVATLDDVEIGKGEELPTLEVRPKSVVTTYIFSIKTEGLKTVSYTHLIQKAFFEMRCASGVTRSTPSHWGSVSI